MISASSTLEEVINELNSYGLLFMYGTMKKVQNMEGAGTLYTIKVVESKPRHGQENLQWMGMGPTIWEAFNDAIDTALRYRYASSRRAEA